MSLFTVEQLELIRRLRATNITAQQILEAFAQLESMENDSDVKMDTVASNDAVPELEATDQTTESIDQMTQSMPQLSCEPSSSAQSPVLLQHLRAQPPVAVTISASSEAVCSSPERLTVQTVPLASTAVQQQDTTPPPQLLMSKYEYNAGGRPIRSQRTPMNDIIVLDDPRELDEFMLQGEEGCIGDMKRFINQYSLRQTTVASMTGVSQPYISKLLNGNHRELSLRCRKNIYCWYLNCRRHPEKLASFLADPSTRLETNSDGELVPQRRERYVFRPILIRLLDGFFAQTPFPDLNKRIEIASACNHVLQLDKKGVGLMPKEVVSPQVVANWFANKRKEYRRRSHGADQVVHHHNGSNPGVSGDEPLPLSNGSGHHEETSSGVGSTPSPLSDGGFRSASQDAARDIAHDISLDGFQFARQPFDIVTLASRLGLTLPLPQRSDSPPLPVATLASQLFAHNLTTAHQPMVSLADQMFTNAQVSLANPLNLLQTAFPMISNENQQLNLNSLAMAYDQLRTPMIKLEQALE